jgi:hypothetical protein
MQRFFIALASGIWMLAMLSPVPARAEITGTMSLRFRVAGPLDFTNVRYVVVFNTSGNGAEPYANTVSAGFANYSFAWIVGGSAGVVAPRLIQYFSGAALGPGLQARPVVVPQQDVQLQVGTSGTRNEFTLTFSRTLFNVPNPGTGRPGVAPTWSVNFMTTDPNGNPIDANGTGGIADVSFAAYSRIDTLQRADLTYVKPAGSAAVSNPSAAISQNEVVNNP